MREILCSGQARSLEFPYPGGMAALCWSPAGERGELTVSLHYDGAYGMGEKYNAVNQKGHTAVNEVEEKFCFQGEKTYCPAPFFWTNTGFGLYAATDERTSFRFGEKAVCAELPVDCRVVLFSGMPGEIIRDYMDLFGPAKLPPKWAFGPWISANHWDSQEKVERAVAQAEEHGFPVCALVAEAWSDEATSNGSLPYYDDYNALLAAPGEGWTVGKDVYGDVTYIKAYAASDSNSTYTLEGSSPVDADGQTYEAEYASLFGASTDTQASVNQNHSGYSGAGFVDKLEAAGAGVTFYAKVANAGDYDVTFRYANGDAAERSLSVYVNGSYIGKTIMPSTGHWDTWADCLMQLPLAAGNNIITLKHEDASGDTGYVNLDSCTVPFYPEVITAEAENAALYGTAGTNQDHWNYSGSGFVDGMTSAGAGAEFEITVPKDGSYEASIRYCNGTQATEDLNLYVNGSYIETISFGSIGGNWNEWQELTQTLELDEGRNVVALRYDSSNSGNVNLDKLSVKTEPDATISVPLVDNGGFERDTSQSSAWTEWHPDGQAVAYGVDSGSGTNPPESPYAGDRRSAGSKDPLGIPRPAPCELDFGWWQR